MEGDGRGRKRKHRSQDASDAEGGGTQRADDNEGAIEADSQGQKQFLAAFVVVLCMAAVLRSERQLATLMDPMLLFNSMAEDAIKKRKRQTIDNTKRLALGSAGALRARGSWRWLRLGHSALEGGRCSAILVASKSSPCCK